MKTTRVPRPDAKTPCHELNIDLEELKIDIKRYEDAINARVERERIDKEYGLFVEES